MRFDFKAWWQKLWRSDEGKIFLLSFAFQLALFLFVYHFHRADLMFDDKDNHFIYVNSILKHHVFAMVPSWGPDAYRTPLYPFVMAGIYAIGRSVPFILFLQNVLAAVNSLLVFKLGKKLISRPVGWIAALLFIFETEHWMTANLIRAEQLFIFFLLLSFLSLVHFIQSSHRRYQWAGATGILLGLATLTRPTSQLLIVLFLGVLWIPWMSLAQKHFSLRTKMIETACMVFAFVVVLAPWSIRNHLHFHTFKLAPNFAFNAYFNLAVDVRDQKLRAAGVTTTELRRRGEQDLAKSFIDISHRPYTKNQVANMFVFGSFAAEPYFNHKTLAIFHADPWFFIRAVVVRDAQFLINSGFAYNLNLLTDRVVHLSPKFFYPWLFWGGRLLWITFYLIIVLHVVLLWRDFKGKLPVYLLCCGVLAYFTLLALLPSTRYRLPANAFIFIMVADSAIALYKKYEGRLPLARL